MLVTILLLVWLRMRLWLAIWRGILCRWLRLNAWAAVQATQRCTHQWLHTRLDLCAHCFESPVSTDALLRHATCVVCTPWRLLDKSALAELLRWAAVLVGGMVLIWLRMRLWLANWRSILCCWLRVNGLLNRQLGHSSISGSIPDSISALTALRGL